MTAPGQEPDEVITAKPGGKDDDSPDLDAVGDNHMPDDLRRSERARLQQRAGSSNGDGSGGD